MKNSNFYTNKSHDYSIHSLDDQKLDRTYNSHSKDHSIFE